MTIKELNIKSMDKCHAGDVVRKEDTKAHVRFKVVSFIRHTNETKRRAQVWVKFPQQKENAT